MADLPKLNDARRCARMTMVFDELLHCKDVDDPFTVSALEFKMCGGNPATLDKSYSTYRQFVYAIRDLKAYLRKGSFPSCSATKKAKQLYIFHSPKSLSNESEDGTMKTKDFNRILRLLIILKKKMIYKLWI